MCDTMNLTAIVPKDIQDLLQYFSKNTYRAKEADAYSNLVLQRSVELMKVDYSVSLINNSGGELSTNYPSQLLFLEGEQDHFETIPGVSAGSQSSQRTTNTIYENTYDTQKLREVISKARLARCRARFPVPVILYRGKYVCRSGTLSGGPEIYGRSGLDYIFYGSDSTEPYDNDDSPQDPQVQWHLFNKVRGQDIKLLKMFHVGTIIDFMVENKKVKFGMNVTSSEKIDKENRYCEFSIVCLPYPGCEFFKEFKDSNYTAEGLVFDWSQTYMDACIRVPNNTITAQLNIKWDLYKNWDLVVITQNYMRLMLKYLQENNSGLLIHCISGWDRTPLFISLLRLSLWADGLIHPGLDEVQILYLTIAYDWMLFGHHFVDRLGKGEEIFFFCFYMLKHLIDDDFSICGWQRYKSGRFSDRSSDRNSERSSCDRSSCDRSSDRSSSERSDKDRSSLDRTEKCALRADSDLYLDGMLLDQDSRGSNVSLNSACSSVSRESHDQPFFTFNLNEESSNGLRQRQESSSSLSVGSWQMITGTGSLRSSDSGSTIEANGSVRYDGHSSQDSTCTLIDDVDYCVNGISTGYSLRKERLLKVRELFYNCYYSTVNSNIKYVSDTSLAGLVGTIMEKAGFHKDVKNDN